MTDPKLNFKRYPRSVSWQMANVLNPSLQNSLSASQQSKHAREKRERSDTGAPVNSVPSASWKPWQEEESLPVPPQYVSLGALCKAMPKYMRVKARPDQMRHADQATTVATTTSATSCSPGNHTQNHSGNLHHLLFSPDSDVVVGSPRSDHSSAKLTPRSVLDSPKQQPLVPSNTDVTLSRQARKLAIGVADSAASPARSPGQPPVAALVANAAASGTTTPPSSPTHQNTPQLQATSGSRSSLPHSPSASRRHSGVQSPRCYRAPQSSSSRIRSVATSPMHPYAVAAGAGGWSFCRGQVLDATSLRSTLNSTIAQHPELQQRVVLPPNAVRVSREPLESCQFFGGQGDLLPPREPPPAPPALRV